MISTEVENEQLVKIGSVPSAEIESIMNGGELIRVDKADIENIFDLSKTRRSVVFSLAPMLNDSISTNYTVLSILGLIVTTIVAVNTTFDSSAFFSSLATLCGIIAIVSFFTFLFPLMESDNAIQKLAMCIGSLVTMGGSIGVIYLLDSTNMLSQTNGWGIGFMLSAMATMALMYGYIYYAYQFALTSVTLNALDPNGSNWGSPTYASSSLPRNYEALCEHIKRKPNGYNIPVGIVYTVANQLMMNPSWTTTIEYVKPAYDKNVRSRREQIRLNKDPAVIMRRNDNMYLAGAWDVKEDINALKLHIKKETKEDIKTITDIRSKLSKREFNKLVNKMRTKLNSQL